MSNSGAVLATELGYGTGIGPLTAFDAGKISTLPITLAGSNPQQIGGMAVSSIGVIYLADTTNCLVEKVLATGGTPSIVAETGVCGESGDGGPATSAMLNHPSDVAVGGSGDLYIADSGNEVIREVDATTGIITVVAGTPGSTTSSGDGGPATSASFHHLQGLTLDGANNLFVSDAPQLVRRIDAVTGVISTVAGNVTLAAGYSGDGSAATSAQINNPVGLAVDSSGNFYIADAGNRVVRMVSASTGFISTVAGQASSSCAFSGDGGVAINAALCDPEGVAVNAAGDTYIADGANDVVRKVSSATGLISTAVGVYNNGTAAYTGDGDSARLAGLSSTHSVQLDGDGNLYVNDQGNRVIRQVATASGVANFGSFTAGSSSPPINVALSNAGNATLSLNALAPSPNFNLNGSNTSCSSNTTLAPGANCALGIEFLPTAGGPLTGSVGATDNVNNT